MFDELDGNRSQQTLVSRRSAISEDSLSDSFGSLKSEFSAQTIITKKQTVFTCISLLFFAAILTVWPSSFIFFITLVFTFLYLASGLVRIAILSEYDTEPISSALTELNSIDKRYTVLVAIYKEANQVDDLIAALSQLEWPSDKIEIYIVCEADDLETITAVQGASKPEYIKLLICPLGTPKTKPRALNYALLKACGDYLVIFDAEDRPHPSQLRQAHRKFKTSNARVACVQAPLIIDNVEQSILCKMFAIEYCTLFFGINPALAKWQAPMPLGGTSNHFKLSILREAGGWDAFNVTEDADLGIRLARLGYNCEMITLPTFEEAPVKFKSWLGQRTRWIKGWLQTLLVHFRNPLQLYKELGFMNHFLIHMILTTIVISVLIHPFFLSLLIYQLVVYFIAPQSLLSASLFGLCIFNLMIGYLSYGLLAYAIITDKGLSHLKWNLALLPIYWVLISIAGWRAICQLISSPHHWEKTEHGKTARNTPSHFI